MAQRIGNTSLTDRHLLTARNLEPLKQEYVQVWVASVRRRGGLDGEIATAELAAPVSRAARYRLIYLYRAAGRADDARRVA